MIGGEGGLEGWQVIFFWSDNDLVDCWGLGAGGVAGDFFWSDIDLVGCAPHPRRVTQLKKCLIPL